jgi:hypothetical protein
VIKIKKIGEWFYPSYSVNDIDPEDAEQDPEADFMNFNFFEPLSKEEKEEREKQRESFSLVWLKKTIKVDENRLTNILTRIREGSHLYHVINHRKRDGGIRKICIPEESLKKIQKQINKHILTDFPPAKNIFGFSGGNIKEAIMPHLEAKSILCADIKNAFPSVKIDRIINLLTEGREVIYGSIFYPVTEQTWKDETHPVVIRFKPGYLSWYAARAIAQLVTFKGRLPQGAPTSPRIFDMTCKSMDRSLSSFAMKVGATYTRYADNLFFSLKQEEFPKPVKNAVLRRIRGAKFKPHEVTIRTLNKEAIRILGLNLTDGKIHNTRKFKENLRLSLYRVKWLLEKLENPENGNDNGNKNELETELKTAWQKLQGQMNFAITDTLPPKLLENYNNLQKQLK